MRVALFAPPPPSFCDGSGLYMTTQAFTIVFFTAGKAGKNVSGEVHVTIVDLSSMQLWNTDHGKQKAVQALNDSLKRSVDLYKNSVIFSCMHVYSLLQA